MNEVVVRAGLNASISQNAVCGFPVTTAQASVPGAHLDFPCDPPRSARYISVHAKGPTTVLTLCEVFVYKHTSSESPQTLTEKNTVIHCNITHHFLENISFWVFEIVFF